MRFANTDFQPKLVIFDKDGTLIDFGAMWGRWTLRFAERLSSVAGNAVLRPLAAAWGFDPRTGTLNPHGPLVTDTIDELEALARDALVRGGMDARSAGHAFRAAWFTPDPVRDAVPLTDLTALFTTLREAGALVAVATADERKPTEATLAALGVAPLVSAVAAADDGIPLKPAPDAVLRICAQLKIAPADAAMIGDTTMDVRMGRAAGCGLVVGVTSGIHQAADLAPWADVVLPSIADLL